MSFMYLFQVFQRDSFLTVPIALLDALHAQFRGTLKVNHRPDGAFLNEFAGKLIVDLVLGRVKVALLMHYLPENMAVSQRTPLRKVKLVGFFFDGFCPKLLPGVEGVELEGKRPSFGVVVVALEDALTPHVLPLVDRLLDGRDLEEGEESAFACAEISFDGDHS